ncbi:MAG TPA: DUF1080 domain-containing protein [Bryobacteraceae bacterium]|nr:DUF1080 domain-containing protein [Bryobacteraceae bacterium]
MRTAALLLCVVSVAAAAGQWTPLFNGKDLTGWTLLGGKGPGYVIENGVIVCPENGGGNLLTEKDYSDFELELDFKLSPGGNSGVAVRAPLEGDIAYTGMEIQILDQDHEKYKGRLKPWQLTGSVYNVLPAMPSPALKPAGEWNRYQIRAQGTQIQVRLNGRTLVDGDLASVKDPEVLKKHPGVKRTTGRVGFLGHDTRVEFRKIRIREL